MFASSPRLVDLTHPIHCKSPVFPGDPLCLFTPHTTLPHDGYRVTALTMGSHQGTHVDAPSHFVSDGAAVDQLLLEQMIGPARVLDLRHKGEPGSRIDVSDLLPFADRVIPGARLLLHTGWDERFTEAGYFTRAPGLTVEACEWLAVRRVGVLGLDVPTLHPTLARETHVPLLTQGTVIVESLRLSMIAGHDHVYFVAAPLPLVGVDGSPVRAFAMVQPISEGDLASSQYGGVRIATVTTAEDMMDAFHIRETVFVREQGVDLAIERDSADRHALHLLAFVQGKPVGTLRLLRNEMRGTIGRFAVLKAYRGQGVGQSLLNWVIAAAPSLGLSMLYLSAQKEASRFYEQAGFAVTGPEFVEAGIVHVPMARSVFL